MQQSTITLTVQQGPQRGQRFSVAKDSIILGRMAGSDVVISDPEVSHRHASITWEKGQPVIRDLDSTNGTFVNGVRITGPQALRDGDTIGLARVQVGFQCPAVAGVQRAVAEPAPPPPAYAPPPAPLAEAGRGPGGLSWLALGLFGLAVVILVVVAVVGAYLYTQRGEEIAGVPTVVINLPPSGSQVLVGEEVIVQATATDSKGVTRVELLINGVLYHSDASPNPQGQSPFISRQSWQASAPATYTLMVKAYNAAGGISQPAAITVSVAEVSAPGPGEPMATPTVTSTLAPGMPIETWTPVAVTGTAVPTPIGCTLDAAFVADVTVPDGTVFEPGARIDKIWRIRNSGSCPWESGYTWVFVSGDQMGAAAFQTVPATVAGGNVDIGVTMYAPSTPGTYTGHWRMKSPGGEVFGQTCSVQIVVPASASPTPTLPLLPTPTDTATPSPPPSAVIEFTVDDDSIATGDCTTLRVHIENVKEAYLSGGEYGDSGVTGPHWSGSTCPVSTTTYTLHVVKQDASTEDKTVTVNVAPAGPTSVTLTGQAALDGYVIDGQNSFSTEDIRVGNYSSASGERAYRGFMSFDLSGLAAGVTIQSTQLRFYQVDIKGDPYGKLSWFHLMHVDYGSSLEVTDYDTPVLASADLTKRTSPGEWYEVSGTTMRDWIQDDLNNHRPRAQFRLQFSPETDDGATADYVSFESGNDSFGTGNVPQLIITYTP